MARMSKKKFAPMNPFVYDLVLWAFSSLLNLFFREIHPRSSWKIPRKGPVIFVAAPHANQFVDPLILMRVVRMEARRRIAFLIAEKSMRRKFIGTSARLAGSVPVGRALDDVKPAEGRIYLPNPVNDPSLVRGVGTNFESSSFAVGNLLVLPKVNGTSANAEILEVIGPEELRLKKPFKGAAAMRQMTGRDDIHDGTYSINLEANSVLTRTFDGVEFFYAPKVDQTQVYEAVFEKLHEGGCVGIFPEGGSHDRPELLPLKAGVAIMALGALSANPDCGLKIVPCGMNYFHPHKFRSRAVIEFGNPIEVDPKLVELFSQGERHEAIGLLLEVLYNALMAVTVTSPDFDTLLVIQAARRLYNPKGQKLPLPTVVELNRRLVKGYNEHKNDERIIGLKNDVLAYNKQLIHLNIRDHQVDYAKFSILEVVLMLLYRIGRLLLLSAGVLPGLILFAPVFIAGKIISIKKSKEALAASNVKIQGKDVMATWKLLVSLALVPALLTIYTIGLVLWVHQNRVQGYVPDWVPLWAVVIFGFSFLPTITYGALRFGEVGMDIFKSLRPLALSLNPWTGNTLLKLRETRAELAVRVTQLINELGPKTFSDFDPVRIMSSAYRGDVSDISSLSNVSPFSSQFSHYPETRASDEPMYSQGRLSRRHSFADYSSVGVFATLPSTPRNSSRRSSVAGGNSRHGLEDECFTSLDSDVLIGRIRGEIGRRRRKLSQRDATGEGG